MVTGPTVPMMAQWFFRHIGPIVGNQSCVNLSGISFVRLLGYYTMSFYRTIMVNIAVQTSNTLRNHMPTFLCTLIQ